MSKIITRKYIQRITKREGDTSIRRNSGGGGGGGGVSQYWVDDNYVSKEFFNRLFEIHDENGDPILPNDVETEIDNIQAMFGFWTNAYLSALGQNEGGGGAELTLASLADVAVQGVTDGQALVWNAAQGKWVPGEGGGGLDPTAMWAELASTGTQQISKTHLTTALADYLPLAGGTMTNTNLVTNMNADLLDGHHATDFALASAITDMATQTWVSTNYLSKTDATSTYLTKTEANTTYLSISFFRALFRAYTSGGSEVVPNDGSTSTIDNIKAMFGFWTNSYLSALGSNPGGASLTLSSLSDVSISGATAGQVLTYRNGTWRNETPQGGGGLDPTAMWAELATTGTQQINKTHLTTALADYLPLTGGTMTGTIYRKMSRDTSNAEDAIVYVNTSGTPIATMEYHNDAQRLIFNAIGATSVWSDSVGKYSFIIGNNELKYNTYDVWYAGNDGAGSGLDADLLDGHHATDFALASAISDMATQTWVSTNYLSKTDATSTYLTKTEANTTYLSIAFFRALFRAYTSGGSEVVPNGGSTSTIDNIKAMFGFWTNSYLSALGNNPGGASLTLSSLSDVSISGATAGQVLTYRNGTWRNETPQGGGGLDPTAMWAELATTGTQQINKTHLTTALADYLPLTGGTLTGNLNINNANLSVTGNGSMNQLTVGSGSINSVITTVKYTSQSGYGFKIIPDTNRLADFYIFRSNYTSSSTRYSFLYTYFDDEGINTLQMTKSSSENNFNIGQGFASRSGHTNLWGYSINFRTKVGGSTSTTHMTITNTGNVGVGTEAPEYKLDVNGDVRADNFIGNFANKSVTASTIDGLSGSFTFEGNELTTSGYDEVGIQIGSSVDKFQLVCRDYALMIRQNDSGGTNATDWTKWITLPTKLHTSHQLTKRDQWFRFANLTQYGASYLVSIRDNYYNNSPTPVTWIINVGHETVTVTQVGRAVLSPTSLTKLRIVRYTLTGYYGFHLEVYTPYQRYISQNTPEINIMNLGRDNMADGVELVHDPDYDTKWLEVDKNIASGETLIEEAEISTGTMIAGDMLLNNDQYIGWKNNAGTAQRICIGLNSDNDFLIGFTTAGSGYRTYLDGNSVSIRYGTSRTSGIYLDSSGNVGIGTTSPSYKLHVNGSISSNYVRLIDSSSNPYLQFIAGSTNWYLQYYNNAMYMGTGTTNSIMINSSGNVGIGITSPAYKLDVNGDVQATNFRGNFVGNADSATKLKTARTIWGQSFDGTANVSGSITNATTITASSNVSVGGTLGVTGATTLTGHVGIGTSPHSTYVLRANGEVYVSTGLYSHGYVTALSDIRHKDVMGDVKLTVSEVANAPAVKFLWKDRRQEGLQVGSIAQYWQKVMPEAIVEAADGELTMSYGVIALLASIVNAREIVNLKREIAELKRKLQKHGILE